MLLLLWEIGLERKGTTKFHMIFLLPISFFYSRGFIFGIWSACASVGNIFGALLAAAFLKYGYEYAFLVCCFLLICCATICFFAIIPSPEDVGMCLRSFYFLQNTFIFFRFRNQRWTCISHG